ncbi:MAG: hypothetical protein KBA06_00550 [Saprospiraceae bacterium]|nr:hypothetical protein [Saprospiraceae bacterium]
MNKFLNDEISNTILKFALKIFMFKYWFQPVQKSDYNSECDIINNINFYSSDETSTLSNSDIVIFTDNSLIARNFRKHFYQFADHFQDLKIVDLGILRNCNEEFIVPILHELLEINCIPIFVVKDMESIGSIFSILKQQSNYFSVAFMDALLRCNDKKDNFYKNILLKYGEKMHDFAHLGYQTHLNELEEIIFYLDHELDIFRLGSVKTQINSYEPILRDKNALIIHLSSLYSSNNLVSQHSSPAGFSIEEASQLAFYSGESDISNYFGIVTGAKNDIASTVDEQNIATLIWYFLDGISNRSNDYPINTSNMIKYNIKITAHNEDLIFWKSQKSEKWWFEIIKVKNRKKTRSFVPCSFTDFLTAKNNQVPEKYLKALSK